MEQNWYFGLNGSGKSSLLKIIAGVDKNYQGDVVLLQVILLDI
jgi:ABC-type sulfate/molybdate transport systems ATPase subunit